MSATAEPGRHPFAMNREIGQTKGVLSMMPLLVLLVVLVLLPPPPSPCQSTTRLGSSRVHSKQNVRGQQLQKIAACFRRGDLPQPAHTAMCVTRAASSSLFLGGCSLQP